MSGGVLVFLAGGARLGVPLADVTRLVVEDDIAPVPFGHPALAGLMRVDDDVVPVFDLQGVGDDEGARPRRHVEGATVAVIPTARGPVGLRLDRLLGTVSEYRAVDDDADVRAALSPGVRGTLGGAGLPIAGSPSVGDAPFFFFSPDAFIAAVGL